MQEDLDFSETFSHVAKLVNLSCLFVVTAIKRWSLSHLDVNNSFYMVNYMRKSL